MNDTVAIALFTLLVSVAVWMAYCILMEYRIYRTVTKLALTKRALQDLRDNHIYATSYEDAESPTERQTPPPEPGPRPQPEIQVRDCPYVTLETCANYIQDMFDSNNAPDVVHVRIPPPLSMHQIVGEIHKWGLEATAEEEHRIVHVRRTPARTMPELDESGEEPEEEVTVPKEPEPEPMRFLNLPAVELPRRRRRP